MLKAGLPFKVELDNYNDKTLKAMIEAKRISRDKDVKGYNSIEELNEELDKE